MTALLNLWCRLAHGKPLWPIHGKYVCPDCLREYPVLWETPEVERVMETQQ